MNNGDMLHWLTQLRDLGHITDVSQLDAIDTLINAINNDVDGEYARITDIWDKSYRFKEDSKFVKRNLTQLELTELTETQRCILETLIKMMSEDNVVNIRQSDLYEVFGFAGRKPLYKNLNRLVELGYIAKIPYDLLNTYSKGMFSKQTGIVYMVNPILATKRAKDSALKSMYAKLVGDVVITDFGKRLKNKCYVDSSITLATDVTENHKLRINNIEPIYAPTKKTSAAISKSDVSNHSNNIIAQNTQNVQTGSN